MFRFYSNPTSPNRVTVVGEHQNGALNLAVAITGDHEQFMRKKGRKIAEGRLIKGKLIESIPVNKEDCNGNFFHEAATKIAEVVTVTKVPHK